VKQRPAFPLCPPLDRPYDAPPPSLSFVGESYLFFFAIDSRAFFAGSGPCLSVWADYAESRRHVGLGACNRIRPIFCPGPSTFPKICEAYIAYVSTGTVSPARIPHLTSPF